MPGRNDAFIGFASDFGADDLGAVSAEQGGETTENSRKEGNEQRELKDKGGPPGPRALRSLQKR